MVGIAVDGVGQTRPLAKRLGLTFPLLSDTTRATTKAWGVLDPGNDVAWPAIFVIGPDRKVKWRSLVETYKVRPLPDLILEQL